MSGPKRGSCYVISPNNGVPNVAWKWWYLCLPKMPQSPALAGKTPIVVLFFVEPGVICHLYQSKKHAHGISICRSKREQKRSHTKGIEITSQSHC